jgi:hypothetical protein
MTTKTKIQKAYQLLTEALIETKKELDDFKKDEQTKLSTLISRRNNITAALILLDYTL